MLQTRMAWLKKREEVFRGAASGNNAVVGLGSARADPWEHTHVRLPADVTTAFYAKYDGVVDPRANVKGRYRCTRTTLWRPKGEDAGDHRLFMVISTGSAAGNVLVPVSIYDDKAKDKYTDAMVSHALAVAPALAPAPARAPALAPAPAPAPAPALASAPAPAPAPAADDDDVTDVSDGQAMEPMVPLSLAESQALRNDLHFDPATKPRGRSVMQPILWQRGEELFFACAKEPGGPVVRYLPALRKTTAEQEAEDALEAAFDAAPEEVQKAWLQLSLTELPTAKGDGVVVALAPADAATLGHAFYDTTRQVYVEM